MAGLLTKMFGTHHDRQMKLFMPTVDLINSLEPKFKAMTDTELQAMTPEFRQRLDNGTPLDDLLPEAFAVCREASWRKLGMRHYDVQLIGGIVLNSGKIAEMRTGEGKTLVATLPMYLNGLSGKGAHLVTVNDYLAKRDCEWMANVYHFLGLTTGAIINDSSDAERKQAYAADITYGTNNEFGFDYLRDNMKFDLSDYVQRAQNFAIVDECDSILIDEARTPLIISGPGDESVDKYYEVNKVIPDLVLDKDFTMEEKSKTVSLTEEGNESIEKLLDVDNIYAPQHIELLHFVYQGLKAHNLFKKDVDYMVKDGEIVIVDEFTGRLMSGRRWSDGLHQAVEAKEGVDVKSENQTLASITFQNYFRMYNKLSGMTGTADTESVEFAKIYSLEVVVIPTNRPIQRIDHEDIVYKTEDAKYKAIANDIVERHKIGQPVLVGTVSIERSEKISRYLTRSNISHNVLNAKHHEHEAEIISQAGRKGNVTIATNMAGRGTDIVLGGNAEAFAHSEVGESGSEENFKLALEKYQKICDAEKQEVLKAGGLYIIGTERHESRRIDNQLRGRAGRQGDEGASRFYLSLEDDLMRIFNGERIQSIMNKLKVPDDEPITAKMVSRAIEGAQKKVEGHQFDIRKHLLDYDDVMNKQRTSIYNLRRAVLMGEDIERVTLDMLGDLTSHILDTFAHEESKSKDWDLSGLSTALNQSFGVSISFTGVTGLTGDKINEMVSKEIKAAYDKQKEALSEHFEHVQKVILLQTIDTRWKEHLAMTDRLKEGINLRAYAQKDPLIEYKKEAFKAFEEMNMAIRQEALEILFKVQLTEEEDPMSGFEVEDKYDESSFDLKKSEHENPFAAGPATKQSEGNFSLSSGGDNQPEGQKINRAERRRREKLDKKRR